MPLALVSVALAALAHHLLLSEFSLALLDRGLVGHYIGASGVFSGSRSSQAVRQSSQSGQSWKQCADRNAAETRANHRRQWRGPGKPYVSQSPRHPLPHWNDHRAAAVILDATLASNNGRVGYARVDKDIGE
jgi:hypothetical protein